MNDEIVGTVTDLNSSGVPIVTAEAILAKPRPLLVLLIRLLLFVYCKLKLSVGSI